MNEIEACRSQERSEEKQSMMYREAWDHEVCTILLFTIERRLAKRVSTSGSFFDNISTNSYLK